MFEQNLKMIKESNVMRHFAKVYSVVDFFIT